MNDKSQAEKKIEFYKAEIQLLKVDAEPEDLRKIRDYVERIARLQRACDGLPAVEFVPTEAQLNVMDYVNSTAYDE